MEGFLGWGGGAESFKLSVKKPWGKIRPSVLTNEPRETERCMLALLRSRRNSHSCFKNTFVFLGSGPVFLPAGKAERSSVAMLVFQPAGPRPFPQPGPPHLGPRLAYPASGADTDTITPALLTRLPEQTAPRPPEARPGSN